MKFYPAYKKQNGASAVEFALILPLLLLFLFGVIEWGIYFFDDHIVTNASRTGARSGIVQTSPRVQDSDITSAVLDKTGSLVTFGAENTPQVEIPAVCAARGDELAVTVSYNYSFLLLPALTGGLVPPSKTISARTVMKCE